ncbi:Chromosome-partitioning protein Spo0J [Acetatifactor muris]|uniref:Chromosome-partitioning protein Spo0J n=3 Tax=Acetatifactor muris TaxID=879566 RepID=A0A2K4ZLE1_9FIRM|nr:Chromosome-partitioning protein Spo0J [Acetatifactor muris]
MDESMADMAESVKQYGVLVPALVREKPEGGYEMIAGHRRKMASELAEKKEIPCIVRNLTDDEAVLIMVDSNLQREQILPSEKAFAYKMKLDAMKRQAGRPCKNNSVPVGQNFGQTSRELLAEKSPDSNTQIQRYIRLTELITPILDMVDSGKIAIRPAVELSYLPKEQQTILLDTMQLEDCTPSHAQAIKMRKFADEGRLNGDVILSILSEEKGNQKEQFRMPKERISRYFSPGTPAKQMEDTIVKALELYRKRERSKDRER